MNPLAVATILCAAQKTAQTPQISDYFPLASGSKWTYAQTVNGSTEVLEYVAGPPTKVGKQNASPVSVSGSKGTQGTTYYYIENNTVQMVAYDPKSPLTDPRPILRVEAKPTNWVWDGVEGGVAVHMEAASALKGRRKVLGEVRDILELRIRATLGNRDLGWRIDQTGFYAKGLGLAEMQQEEVLNKQRTKLSLLLMKYEPSSGKS